MIVSLTLIERKVYLYRLERAAPTRPYSLVKLSEVNHNYIINSISTAKAPSGTHVFVSDTFNSISLFKMESAKLQIVAKAYTPNWTVGMHAVGERSAIGADVSCNAYMT